MTERYSYGNSELNDSLSLLKSVKDNIYLYNDDLDDEIKKDSNKSIVHWLKIVEKDTQPSNQ